MNVPWPFSFRPRRVPLATRSLLRDWVRLIISIGGIGFAILLVLLLDGIREGTVAKSTTYIDNVGADLFVAQEGVTNMTLTVSGLPTAQVAAVEAVDGVAEAAGIIRVPVIVSSEGEKRPSTLIGYDPARGLGGPWKLERGRTLEGEREAVVDSALAGELGLGLGDSLEVIGGSFTVVGLSGETANIAGKLLFLTLPAVQQGLFFGDRISFVLVRVEAANDPDAVATALNEQLPGITATPRDDLSSNDRDLLGSLFVAPINVMATVGFLVALAIIGLTMYTTTAERLRDFGVLKAIGARNAYLFRTVISQAVVLGLTGFLAGLGAAQIAGPFIVDIVPDIGITISPLPALRTLGAAVAMSLLGAVIPVVRITRVDPLAVFRR